MCVWGGGVDGRSLFWRRWGGGCACASRPQLLTQHPPTPPKHTKHTQNKKRYILGSKPDEYVFVYYRGNNDAWKVRGWWVVWAFSVGRVCVCRVCCAVGAVRAQAARAPPPRPPTRTLSPFSSPTHSPRTHVLRTPSKKLPTTTTQHMKGLRRRGRVHALENAAPGTGARA